MGDSRPVMGLPYLYLAHHSVLSIQNEILFLELRVFIDMFILCRRCYNQLQRLYRNIKQLHLRSPDSSCPIMVPSRAAGTG